jgi:hypothetical protein
VVLPEYCADSRAEIRLPAGDASTPALVADLHLSCIPLPDGLRIRTVFDVAASVGCCFDRRSHVEYVASFRTRSANYVTR